MKSNLVVKEKLGVDPFSIPTLVTYTLGGGKLIILTNGFNSGDKFSGVVLLDEENGRIGHYSENWTKSSFAPLDEDLTITLNN